MASCGSGLAPLTTIAPDSLRRCAWYAGGICHAIIVARFATMGRGTSLRRLGQAALRRGLAQQSSVQSADLVSTLPLFDVRAANAGSRCFLTTLSSRGLNVQGTGFPQEAILLRGTAAVAFGFLRDD